MVSYKHRDLASIDFLGERVDFVASNERIQERVANLSKERIVIDTLAQVANPDDVIWDLGACLGIHSFILAKHLDDGEVYSFEPMHANRAICVDNKAVNELENVTVSRVAVSDSNGDATFEVRESIEPGYGRHGLQAEDADYDSVMEVTVPTKRGDSLDFEQPNIVKIDVEGASPLVLRGMEETLSDPACKAVILETHEPNPVQPSHEDFGMTRSDLIDTLEAYGFTVQTLEEEFLLYGVKEQQDTHLLADTDRVELVQGDISSFNGDAIINSAGTTLRMGTGVAGSLREAGGDALYKAALKEGPVDLGDAVVTDGFELDASYVIHAASMPHYGDGKSTQESIRTATVNALDKAEARDCQTVAIPAIGCGLGGVSLSTGASTILNVLNEYEYNTIEDIQFYLYTDEEYTTVSNFL